MTDIDLDNLTTVKKSSIQKQNFDFRYSHAGERFQLSDAFYAKKAMNSNGFTFHLANNGQIPLLSIRPNEESVFYKGKAGDQDKSTVFSYGILESGLRDLGLISDDASFDNFKLEFVKEKDGADYYMIKPMEGEDAPSVEAEQPEESAPEVAEVPEDTNASEEAAEEDDDPFSL